jgi:hypothetical protein
MDTCNKSLKSGEDVFKYLKAIKDISSEIDRCLSRKQQLSTSIFTVQEKTHGYMAASQLIQVVFDEAMKIDPVFGAELKSKFRDNPQAQMAYKKFEEMKE